MILSEQFSIAYSAPVPANLARTACVLTLRYFSASVDEQPESLQFSFKANDGRDYDGAISISDVDHESQIKLTLEGSGEDVNVIGFVHSFENILVGQLYELQDGMTRHEIYLTTSFRKAYQRCIEAIQSLGWELREDLTREDRITCYVPIPELLPNAPVYFISFFEMNGGRTRITLVAASDELSQSHARDDFRRLKEAVDRAAAAPQQRVQAAPATQAAPQEQAVKQEHGGIFLSYRRYDSADVTGRIYDRLLAVYGKDRLFKDVDSIPFGMDFRQVIEDAVGSCSVVLAIIGRDWLTATNEHGQRRLDDPTDFVRLEIEAALTRKIPLIPLLVREMNMPRPDDLPSSLQELCYRHGTVIRPDPDFHRDMDRLIEGLQKLLDS